PMIALLCVPAGFAGSAREYLERHGYDVRAAGELWEAQRLLAEGRADIAVAGPGETGMELLRRHAAEDGAPAFLMLTTGNPVLESVLALELGAADAVEATVTPRELAARV